MQAEKEVFRRKHTSTEPEYGILICKMVESDPTWHISYILLFAGKFVAHSRS